MKNELVLVARLGRVVGVKGFVRLHNFSDFPQQFKRGVSFFDKENKAYTIKERQGENVLFEGFESVEATKNLVNLELFQSVEESRKSCKLKKDEYFYFDIIGLKVLENELLLGVVKDILESRNHLFLIKSDENLVKKGFASEFYLPYMDFYIEKIDLQEGKICAKNALNLLESL